MSRSNPSVTTHLANRVLVVTLNRPDVLNAIDDSLLAGLAEATDAAADPAVGAVVLTGAGRGCCSGADRKSPGAVSDAPGRGLRFRYNPVLTTFTALDKPIVSAINGVAVGAGLSLALLADVRIAAESARFKPAFLQLGVVPDAGATWFVTRLLGEARALEWFVDGRILTSREALGQGLVTEIAPDGKLLVRAVERAAELVAASDRIVAMTRKLVAEAARAGLSEQLERETSAQLAVTFGRTGGVFLSDDRFATQA